jgi:putative Holliday junction resolvase
MKYLGIDYGTKWVGVAISDEDGSFAFPKAIFETPDALSSIDALCKLESVGSIVIGESVATNGQPNDLANAVNIFRAKLAMATEIPIFFEREGFSTVEAHRYQVVAGRRDDSAAAIILQRFLDKQKK